MYILYAYYEKYAHKALMYIRRGSRHTHTPFVEAHVGHWVVEAQSPTPPDSVHVLCTAAPVVPALHCTMQGTPTFDSVQLLVYFVESTVSAGHCTVVAAPA